MSRRRLSHCNEYLGNPINVEEDEELLRMTRHTPRNSLCSNSSRLSIGSRHSVGVEQSMEEQSRIADMYKTVIKMSSENKINEKNSWSFDLIDHMGKLIRDEGRGINFQKASCTLDASVKIYSHRVDDTHASGHRILESLSRNGNPMDGENDGQDEDGSSEQGTTRRHASNRHNIGDTIERNVDLLNNTSGDNTQTTDPLFHKMSKAFDEGGAKGMLMNNMRVGEHGCNLVFQCDAESTSENNTNILELPNDNDMVDISDLIYKSGIMLSELSDLEVCPAFDDYRSALGVADSLVGVVTPTVTTNFLRDLHRAVVEQERKQIAVVASSSSSATTTGFDDVNSSDNMPEPEFNLVCGDDDDDMDFRANEKKGGKRRLSMCRPTTEDPAVVSDDENDRSFDAGGCEDIEEMLPPEPMDGDYDANKGGKINWDAVFEDRSAGSTGRVSGGELASEDVNVDAPVALWQDITATINLPGGAAGVDGLDDYRFLDLQALNINNTWAGSRHWKFPSKSRSADTQNVDESEQTDKKKKKATTKTGGSKGKPASQFDFTAPRPSEDLFATASGGGKRKTKSDPSVQSAAVIAKQLAAAESGALKLPIDSRLDIVDLCRLNLVPNIVFPGAFSSPQIKAMLLKKLTSIEGGDDSQGQSTKRVNIHALTDKVWGDFVDFSSLNRSDRLMGGDKFGAFKIMDSDHAVGADDFDDDGDYGNDGDFGGGMDYDQADMKAPVSSADEPDNLAIQTDGLLKAARVVEKVDVGYSTTTTKVNVRKLKLDIWSKIDETIMHPQDPEMENAENAGHGNHPTEKPSLGTTKKINVIASEDGTSPEKLSFQDLISSMAGSANQQPGASLPFYFICLLHLANEKTLCIEDTENMDDLLISNGNLHKQLEQFSVGHF